MRVPVCTTFGRYKPPLRSFSVAMKASFAHPPMIRRRPPTDKTLNGI